MLIIGSHVSFNGEQLLSATKEAISYNANTFMFYTGAPTNTTRLAINPEYTLAAQELMQKNGIDIKNVICHAPYIVNPATADPVKSLFAANFIKQELSRCATLGIKYLVLHPGSSVGISKEEGLNNIINVLNQALDNEYDVTLLLETMAGKGNECGTSTAELAYIINHSLYPNKLGVCLDTCHLNDAGIDETNFDLYLDDFNNQIGLEKIKCLHLNDSKNEFNSHKDRHANIGKGTIGFDNLLKIIYNPRLENIPKILETPYIGDIDDSKERLYPPYRFEIAMLRSKKYNPDYFSEIRSCYQKK